ncbi:MAG TPA: hypothetical protein VHV55_03995, partial [Pirellulales bacterium]|nr:hypothetical protein [Pirellulales bacterium]
VTSRSAERDGIAVPDAFVIRWKFGGFDLAGSFDFSQAALLQHSTGSSFTRDICHLSPKRFGP